MPVAAKKGPVTATVKGKGGITKKTGKGTKSERARARGRTQSTSSDKKSAVKKGATTPRTRTASAGVVLLTNEAGTAPKMIRLAFGLFI